MGWFLSGTLVGPALGPLIGTCSLCACTCLSYLRVCLWRR